MICHNDWSKKNRSVEVTVLKMPWTGGGMTKVLAFIPVNEPEAEGFAGQQEAAFMIEESRNP